jgi:membrane protein
VVIALALSVVVARALEQFTDALPPRHTWTLVITFVLDALGTVFLPWLLLAGKVPVRRLVPGAILFALVLLVMRPVARAFLPGALEESADRYGTIGVAFTYIALLYIVALAFLGTMILGYVIAEDQGRLGQYFRRGGPTPRIDQSALSGEPTVSGEPTEPVEPTGWAAPSGSAEPESTTHS